MAVAHRPIIEICQYLIISLVYKNWYRTLEVNNVSMARRTPESPMTGGSSLSIIETLRLICQNLGRSLVGRSSTKEQLYVNNISKACKAPKSPMPDGSSALEVACTCMYYG